MPFADTRRSWLLWLLVMSAIALSFTAVASTGTCSGNICTPYITAANGGIGCLRKNPINLRFMLHMAQENHETVGTVVHRTATYGFTPCVDALSSLTLSAAPYLTSAYTVAATATTEAQYHITANQSDKYLAVYGFGMSNQTDYPQHGISAGSVLVAKNGQEACGDSGSVGVVTILSLSVGLRKGYFNYLGQSGRANTTIANPHYTPSMCGSSSSAQPAPAAAAAAAAAASSSSSTIDYCSPTITVVVPEVSVQPAEVGFVPTCNAKDQCVMGDPDVYTCIGNVTGKKNCGLCYSDATQLAQNASMTVWLSYIGTDRKSVVLTSSGENPINYISYMRNGALTTISSKFRSIVRGNLSDWGL